MNIQTRSSAVIQAIREGAEYRTVIAHRLGMHDRDVIHALRYLEGRRLVLKRFDNNKRERFGLANQSWGARV
jgi:hypothetical protein